MIIWRHNIDNYPVDNNHYKIQILYSRFDLKIINVSHDYKNMMQKEVLRKYKMRSTRSTLCPTHTHTHKRQLFFAMTSHCVALFIWKHALTETLKMSLNSKTGTKIWIIRKAEVDTAVKLFGIGAGRRLYSFLKYLCRNFFKLCTLGLLCSVPHISPSSQQR